MILTIWAVLEIIGWMILGVIVFFILVILGFAGYLAWQMDKTSRIFHKDEFNP